MLGITSLSSITQIKNENSDIKVSAVIKSGCFISMQNIVFGNITKNYQKLIQKDLEDFI